MLIFCPLMATFFFTTSTITYAMITRIHTYLISYLKLGSEARGRLDLVGRGGRHRNTSGQDIAAYFKYLKKFRPFAGLLGGGS